MINRGFALKIHFRTVLLCCISSLFVLFLIFFKYFFYVSVLPTYETRVSGTYRGDKRARTPGTGVVNYSVGTGDQTRVLWKTSQCS